jgi:rhamnosyltransferase subunit B
MTRILIHTLGSSGDVNPFFALAEELRKRGHAIRFALSPSFAAQAQQLGFDAVAAGPDPQPNSELMQRLLTPSADVAAKVRMLFQDVLIPAIAPAVAALEPLAREADLLISHSIQLAAPAVAERTGIQWITALPAGVTFPANAYIPNVAWRRPPQSLAQAAWWVGKALMRSLDAPVNAEYHKLGLAPRRDILFSASFSRLLTVGLLSPAFFPQPKEWPSWLQVGGYARWDMPSAGSADSLPAQPWDTNGHPHLVFTLGSSVVNDPRGFYETALQAISPTPWYATLLGAPHDLPIPNTLRSRIQIIPYAPYAALFPTADAVIHQGGVGTTQAACYYGIPAVVVPRGFDQWENAAHLQRSGWGLRLRAQNLSPGTLRTRLSRLLTDQSIRQRVTALGQVMQAEPGPQHSADLVEAALEA